MPGVVKKNKGRREGGPDIKHESSQIFLWSKGALTFPEKPLPVLPQAGFSKEQALPEITCGDNSTGGKRS